MATPYTLPIVMGQHLRVGFRYLVDDVAVDLSDWSWQAQARQREQTDAELMLDLTEHIELDDDEVTLWLTLTSSVTFECPKAGKNAAWDFFIWPTSTPEEKTLLVQGPVTTDLATTDLAS